MLTNKHTLPHRYTLCF